MKLDLTEYYYGGNGETRKRRLEIKDKYKGKIDKFTGIMELEVLRTGEISLTEEDKYGNLVGCIVCKTYQEVEFWIERWLDRVWD